MRVRKIIMLAPLFVAATVALLVCLRWLDHTRQTTLPAPTGPFTVGRTQYVWTENRHRVNFDLTRRGGRVEVVSRARILNSLPKSGGVLTLQC
jgi:hypothetical protein